MTPFKSGLVAIVGPPNVGKSTLLNSLLGEKISIVSPKAQTTRNRISGILNGADYQIVLLDTPGLHEAWTPLNKEMVKIAVETLKEVDAILFMRDASTPLPPERHDSTEFLEKEGPPAILLLNKIDLVIREKLLPLIARYAELYPFRAVVPLSARTGDGIERIIEELLPLLPEGPALYPADIPTDATERFIVAEMIREKVFLFTGQEVPYSTAVMIDSFKEDADRGMVTIDATIFVEKASQKGILIGKGGATLKKIGQAARHDIEALLGQRVMLKLWVKVRKNWSRDPRFLQELGF